MTATPATPQPKQWTVLRWMHGTTVNVRYQLYFGGERLLIYKKGQYWHLDSYFGTGRILSATTAEQAAAEAVAAISQRLDWLREELAAIPLTLPTTPTT